MKSLDTNEESLDIMDNISDAMSKYRITRVTVDYYHYKEFRYASLEDAIAQAKQQCSKLSKKDMSNPMSTEMRAAGGLVP